MGGTITTKEYCLVEGTIAYTGTKASIVSQLCEFHFDEERRLVYEMKHCVPVKLFSYGKGWLVSEMHADAINVLFSKMVNMPQFRLFRDIGF